MATFTDFERFNFLRIFLEEFKKYEIEESNDKCIVLLESIRGEQLQVIFAQRKITLILQYLSFSIKDYNTVQYVYYLMGLCHEQWMSKVLKMEPMLLSLQCRKNLPGHVDGESKLRRFLTPVVGTPVIGLLDQLMEIGQMMSVENYGSYYIKNIDQQQTIYSHDFQFFGQFSETLNFYTLIYLLMIEAVLDLPNNWEEMYPGCYYCTLELCQFVIWRQEWLNNVHWFVFLDNNLLNASNNTLKQTVVSSEVIQVDVDWDTSTPNIFDTLLRYPGKVEMFFLTKYFFSKSLYQFKIYSLKDICKYQLSVFVFLRRLHLFSTYKLTMRDVNMPKQIEDDDEFKTKLLMLKGYFQQMTSGIKKTYVINNSIYTYTDRLKLDDVQFIWDKGTKFPIEVHLDMLKISSLYWNLGYLFSFQSLNTYSKVFTNVRAYKNNSV